MDNQTVRISFVLRIGRRNGDPGHMVLPMVWINDSQCIPYPDRYPSFELAREAMDAVYPGWKEIA